jgi:hypothetical protein
MPNSACLPLIALSPRLAKLQLLGPAYAAIITSRSSWKSAQRTRRSGRRHLRVITSRGSKPL